MFELQIPEFIALSGQTGAGKDTTTRILDTWCVQAKKTVFSFGSGDLIREYAKKDTPLGNEVRRINSRGERVSLQLISELIEDVVRENHGKYDHILLNGTPRYADHCDILHKFVTEKKYVRSLLILEVIAPDDLCRTRVAERTKYDLREDLSIDGQPGVPDFIKIDRKICWWTAEKYAIRQRAQQLGIYQSVHNDRDEIFLKNQLSELITKKAIP